MIEFPPYEPDRSIFDPGNTDTVQNVLPVAGGWGPMKGHSALATALSATAKGGVSTINSSGQSNIFCGTTDTLYKFNSTTYVFDDVSTAATTYDVPNGDFWDFHQFGDILLATNQNDGLYYFDLNSGTNFVEVTASPHAKYVTSVGEYVMLLHLDGFPNRAQWSQIGSVTDWTVGTAGADYQDLPDGGEIRGVTFGEDSVHILQQRGIRAVQYIGGDYTFQFQKVNSARGLASAPSLITAANTFFWVDEDGFYRWSGGQAVPIGGEKVDRTFIEDFDLNRIGEIQGAADPTNKIVWWLVTNVDNTKEMIGYDWQLDRWTRSDTNMSYIFPAVSTAVTLEGLDNISASIDALQYSLDSRVWLGGRPSLAGFDSSNAFGYFDGSNLAAVVETADVKLQPENNRSFVNGYRVITDASTHTGQVAVKDEHYDTLTWDMATSPISGTGLVTSRANGRLHRFRCNVPAASSWSYVQAVMPVFRPGGRR
jgi:hypothetical protein